MRNRILGIALIALVLGCLSFISNNEFKETAKDNKEDKGIIFQTMSLEEAKLLSKKTGKLIFIDIYASWCGPCKMMAKGPFKDKKVGSVYNSSFINLKIDAEKDADGEFVSRAYAVSAYPTTVFIDGDGKLIKKFVGYRSEDNLLGMAEMANPSVAD